MAYIQFIRSLIRFGKTTRLHVFSLSKLVLYTNIDQTLVNSLHELLNCAIGGLDCHAITAEYRTRVHCIHT